MITIDVDKVTRGGASLIILYKTGVMYTAQCGGVGCTHPKAEGYVLSIGDFALDFDDCSYGCYHLDRPGNMDARQRLAKDFDDYCIEKTKFWNFKIRFDYSRIDEVQEGWLPVVVDGVVDRWENFELSNSRGIIHNGNCD